MSLGEVAVFIRGITFKPQDVGPVSLPGAVACMRTSNVQSVLDLSDVWGVRSSLVKRDDQFLRQGDVLVSSANSWNLVGKCCWVPELPLRSTFGGFVSVLRADPQKVDPRFLFRWFASTRIQATVRSFGQRTTSISNLNLERCSKLPFPLLPLPQQRRIAEVLDRAEALRAKRRAALAQLDTLTQSIFRDMFGDIRGPSANLRLAQFEDIVAETKLGLVRGSQELGPDLPVPYVRMNAITRAGELDLADVQRTRTTQAEFDAYRLRAGDLLFNTRNSEELVGKTALYRGDGSHVFNNNIMRIRFTGEADPEFVAAAFNTLFVQRELSFRKSGTTSVFAIYYKDLRSLPLPVPPIELQRAFASRVGATVKLKMAELSGLAQFDALFAAIQDRAFQGEL